MNIRVFAVLFTAIFICGAIPMLLIQPSGSASAGLAAGFASPIENPYHICALVGIGLIAAWQGTEALILLPLAALLMLAIGALMQVDEHVFHAAQGFIVGAIILFALSMSLMRKSQLPSVPPIALWIYFAGQGYMAHIPSITTPLYFLLGALISAALMIAIGVSSGITLTEGIQNSMGKLKNMPAISSFLSLF